MAKDEDKRVEYLDLAIEQIGLSYGSLLLRKHGAYARSFARQGSIVSIYRHGSLRSIARHDI